MFDISLLYIGAVILIVAAGFVFALRMAMAAAQETDRGWPSAMLTPAEAVPAEAPVPPHAA